LEKKFYNHVKKGIVLLRFMIVGLFLGTIVTYVPLSQENENLKVQIATLQA